MRLFTFAFILTVFLAGCSGSDKKKDSDYQIVLHCEKTEPKVHVVVINKVCYVYNTQDISSAIRESKISAGDIKEMLILKEGGTPQWKTITALLPSFKDRIISVVEIVMK